MVVVFKVQLANYHRKNKKYFVYFLTYLSFFSTFSYNSEKSGIYFFIFNKTYIFVNNLIQ